MNDIAITKNMTPSTDPVLDQAIQDLNLYIEKTANKIIDYKKQNAKNKNDNDITCPNKEQLSNLIPVSDVLDEQGHQYVDLVMEGGGMLGIALLGYIGVLERLNIRFLNVAGSSAGAITATLLMGIGKVEEEKFPKLLEILTKKPFSEFVDGEDPAKRLIEVGLQTNKSKLKLLWSAYKAWPNLRKNLGLNPGNEFENWMSENLLENNNLDNFHNFLQTNQPNLVIRETLNRPNNQAETKKRLADLKTQRRLALITADITTGSKVELPAMANLYLDKNHTQRTLASFARASMSVPYFFEPLVFKDLPKTIPIIQQWGEQTNLKLNLAKIKEAQLLVLKQQDPNILLSVNEQSLSFKCAYLTLYRHLENYLLSPTNKNNKQEQDNASLLSTSIQLFRLLPDLESQSEIGSNKIFTAPELFLTQITTESLSKITQLIEELKKFLVNTDEQNNPETYTQKCHKNILAAMLSLMKISEQLDAMDIKNFNFSGRFQKHQQQAHQEYEQLKQKSKQTNGEILNQLRIASQTAQDAHLTQDKNSLDQGLTRIHQQLKQLLSHTPKLDIADIEKIEAIKKEVDFFTNACINTTTNNNDQYASLKTVAENLDNIIRKLADQPAPLQNQLQSIQKSLYQADIFKLAQNELNKLPSSVTFIDGGVISNFPISVFHNKDTGTPLIPTFGVKLGLDICQYDTQSVTSLFSAMFNSTKNTLDFDFIKQNPDYTHLLTYIDIPEDKFNWLDFDMSLRQKMELIRLGADAALKFILSFDWGRYKGIRHSLSQAQTKSEHLEIQQEFIQNQLEELIEAPEDNPAPNLQSVTVV